MSLPLLNKVKKLKALKAERAKLLASAKAKKVVVAKITTPKLSLANFFRESWEILEPSTELIWGWHLEAICAHAEAALLDYVKTRDDKNYVQRIQNLLVHVPPGSSKSRIISVCTTPWVWSFFPGWRGMYLAGTPGVANRDAVWARDLIESDWYQRKFKPTWKIRDDKRAAHDFWNTAGGFRVAGGVDSRITGKRADAIFCDDLDDAAEVFSEPKRLHNHERWDNAIENRVSDPSHPVRIGICQKLHEDDWAGHVYQSGEWYRLRIRQCYVPEDTLSPIGWEDPRKEPGELMDPVRFTQSFIEKEKNKGSYYFSAQHQQEPSPLAGGVFKRESWGLYAIAPQFDRILLSVDTPFKKGPTNDYCSILVIGEVWPPARNYQPESSLPSGYANWREYTDALKKARALDVKRYLLDEFHDKAGIIEAELALKKVSKNWPQATIKIVEEKANGSALCDRLESSISGIKRFNPGSDSKQARAMVIEPYLERGLILLPANNEVQAHEGLTVASWWAINPPDNRSSDKYIPIKSSWKSTRPVGSTQQIDGIIDEFAKFPTAKHDDRVDALSQAIIWSSNNPYEPAAVIKTLTAPQRPVRQKISSLD